MVIRRPEEPVAYATLENGTPFPVRAALYGRYKNGPQLHWTVGIQDGRAVVFDMTFEADPLMDAPSGLTGSMVHDMPVGQIIAEVIARMGSGTLALKRLSEAAVEGRPHQFLTPEEAAGARQGALGSRRGRPVSDDALRRVAEIVKASGDFGYRELIREEFSVSTRTASRWVQQAIKGGLLTEEAAEDE